MLPGPDAVLACPHCGSLVRTRTLQSGNTFGATLWSDGRFEAPMLPDSPAITRCFTCRTWYWLADAEEVGRVTWFDPKEDEEPPAEWRNARHVLTPDAADYADALAAGLGTTPERELFLRLRAWWAANDAFRGIGTVPEPDAANLTRMQGLFAPGKGERGEPVLHAAVAHALGERERALEALGSSRLTDARGDHFRRLIDAGDRRIVALTREAPGA